MTTGSLQKATVMCQRKQVQNDQTPLESTSPLVTKDCNLLHLTVNMSLLGAIPALGPVLSTVYPGSRVSEKPVAERAICGDSKGMHALVPMSAD